jgi:hypothetical protein
MCAGHSNPGSAASTVHIVLGILSRIATIGIICYRKSDFWQLQRPHIAGTTMASMAPCYDVIHVHHCCVSTVDITAFKSQTEATCRLSPTNLCQFIVTCVFTVLQTFVGPGIHCTNRHLHKLT